MADIIGAKLSKKIKKLITQKEVATLAEIARDAIYTRTRLGYGVSSEGGSRERLKKLSDSYKKQRKGVVEFQTKDGEDVKFKIKKPNLHPETTPTKSNLTFTGQMLDALDWRAKGGSFVVETKGARTATRGEGLFGKIKGAFKQPTNQQVAKWVQEQGRPFLFLTKSELNKLTRELKIMILRKLEKT